MTRTENLFIAVLFIFGVLLISFLLVSVAKAESPELPSLPASSSFMTKTIVIPTTKASTEMITDIIILFDETVPNNGRFGWSSRATFTSDGDETDSDDDTDILPCIDENDNEICDEEEEEVSPCDDQNANGVCDNEEIPPCSDADEDSICDADELPEDQDTTLQVPPPHFKIAFIGDSGYGDNYRQVLELIRDENADMAIHAGDLGYDEGNLDAPQLWLNNIETILDPTATEGIFPFFLSRGNHDASHWNNDDCYREILQDRFSELGIEYQGEPELLGTRTSFVYNGVAVVLVAPGEDEDIAGENHWLFAQQQLQDNLQLWDICAWHKNQRAMQIGGKGDEAGWEIYETCREQGAIIATGHEHSYGRTHVLSDMSEQIIADEISPYIIQPGQTFAFHSALGGQSVRDQERCLPETPPYGCNGEWGSIYTSNQSATYGALFIEFNVDDDPRKAHGYFENIDGEIIDEFEIYNNAPEPEEEEQEEEPVIPPAGFVYTQGTELRLDAEPYHFIGFNVYGLANDEDIFACGPHANHGENPEEYLDALFSNLSSQGVNTIRFWAFQSFTNGGTDFSSFDRVIEYAQRYNVKLIPALENHWEDCTQGDIEGEEKSSVWYVQGYAEPYGDYTLSYPDYVRAVVTRYKDEPAILMWQLMNEAESQDAGALYSFTVEMSELVSSIDQDHLISLGTIGRGQAGTQNENFVLLHNIDTIDVVEAHDYNHPEEAWPSSGSNSINRAFTVAQDLNKPFFIGESGISVDSNRSAAARAGLFDAKISAAFDRGVVGYVIWQWDNSDENYGSGCDLGYCVTEGDPVLGVIGGYS